MNMVGLFHSRDLYYAEKIAYFACSRLNTMVCIFSEVSRYRKINGALEIKGSEGCVSLYRYKVTLYFDFPMAMFSSKSATFNL